MASRRLEVVISGNANDAVRALGQTERAVGQFDRSSSRAGSRFSQSWRRGIGEVGRAVTGLVAGAGLVRFFQGSLSEAQQAQQVMRQTAAVIRSTGGVAGVTADHLADLAGRLSDVAAVDDEVIQQGGNVLLTFRNVKEEGGIFDDALASALDMSAALGTDLQGNIIAVGKALNDPAEGLSKLTRMGVTFTDQQKDQIEAMVAFGDTAGAQRIILDELASEFGGAAEANATASQRMSVAWGNVQESIGTLLLPAFDSAASAVSGLATWFTSLDRDAQTAVVAIGGVAIAAAAMYAVLGGPVTAVVLGIAAIGAALWWLADQFPQLKKAAMDFFDSLPERWKQFQKDIEPVKQALADATQSVKHFIKTFDWTAISDAFAGLGDSLEELKNQLGITSSNGQIVLAVLGAAIWAVAIMIQIAINTAAAFLKALARVGQVSLAGVSFWVAFLKGLLSAASTAASTVIDWLKKLGTVKVSVPGLGDINNLLSRAADAARRLWDMLTSLSAKKFHVSVDVPFIGNIKIPGFARGTESAPRGLAMVGEYGPELVAFRGGERVFPAPQTRAMLSGGYGGGGGSSTTIVVNVHGTATPSDGQAVVDALRRWQQRNGPVPVKVSA